MREVGEAHYQAYVETEGVDPERLLWYADCLRAKLSPRSPSSASPRANLFYLLAMVANEQPLIAPGANRARYYARKFISLYVYRPVRFRGQLSTRYNVYLPSFIFCYLPDPLFRSGKDGVCAVQRITRLPLESPPEPSLLAFYPTQVPLVDSLSSLLQFIWNSSLPGIEVLRLLPH